MIVRCANSYPFDQVNKIGIAIMHSGGDQLHTAFLFKNDDDSLELLHLAWHHKLVRSRPDQRYMWADVAELEAEDRRYLVGFLRLIGASNPDIPYGLSSAGVRFDPKTGELAALPSGQGMTCATFILEVLKSVGLFPIDCATWPLRADDQVWQDKIISALESAGHTDHAAAIRSGERCVRFRPEEVVGSTASAGWSHQFTSGASLGLRVRQDLVGSGRL